jgi:protein involved in polysaccharide export with SLBB domain
MKTWFVIFLVAVTAVGCTTRSQARLKEQNAFLAGQNAALRQQSASSPGVTIVGVVQNPTVPWVAGLTLTQAIATANYIGLHEPSQIILTRAGESAALDPKVLLNGVAIPLEPGDVVEIR